MVQLINQEESGENIHTIKVIYFNDSTLSKTASRVPFFTKMASKGAVFASLPKET